MKQTLIKKGDVFWVDFDPSRATEIQKARPAVVCSHDILNENSCRVIVAPITSNLKKIYSFEYAIKISPGLEGKIMLDQLKSIDKSRLGKKICSLSLKEMQEIDTIIKFVFGLQ
jgi:mRNA interferase MazF